MAAIRSTIDETKTGPSGAANANSIPDGRPSHERTAALVKCSIPTPIVDYSTPPTDVTESTHPVTAQLFPGAELGPDVVDALRAMDQSADAALSLFYEAIVEGIKRSHAMSYWTDGTAEIVMSWIYHRYPQVTTEVIVAGTYGIAFQGSNEAYQEERERMERENAERLRRIDVLTLRQLPYQEYLRTDHWQGVRKNALKDADYRCQICNASTTLHVHHRTYERRGEEVPSDVIALCAECHKHFHDKLKVHS